MADRIHASEDQVQALRHIIARWCSSDVDLVVLERATYDAGTGWFICRVEFPTEPPEANSLLLQVNLETEEVR